MWCRYEPPGSCGSHCLMTAVEPVPAEPPSPTRGGPSGAATRWPASWGWPPRCWPPPARWPRSPSGPLTRLGGARRAGRPPRPPDRPADGPRRSPPSAAPWAASTTRHWRWRSAPGWPTVTGVSGVSGADGGRGRRHDPARRPRPPDGRQVHPLAAMDHTTRMVLAQREVDGAPAKPRACGRCWPAPTSPARWSPPRAAPPRRRSRVPGGRQARPLPVHGHGQPSPPCWLPRRPALAAGARGRPHPRPGPRPGGAAHPQGGSAGSNPVEGYKANTGTRRPLTWRNDGQGPCCVSGGARSGPAVGERVCPLRARVLEGGLVPSDARQRAGDRIAEAATGWRRPLAADPAWGAHPRAQPSAPGRHG